MKNLLLIAAFAFCISQASAQSIDLAKYLTGPDNSSPYDMTIAPNGDMIFVGAIVDSVDFDPGSGETILVGSESPTGTSPYICRYDASGNLLWAYVWEISIFNSDFVLMTDLFSNGDILVGMHECCDFEDLDPTEGTYYFNSLDGSNFFIRLNADGEFISVIDVDPNFPGPKQMIIGEDGQLYLSGFGYGGLYAYGMIGKFDPTTGAPIWVKSFGAAGGDTSAPDIAIDANGNIIAAGSTDANTIDLNPGVGTNMVTTSGGYDGYIIKLDNDGNHIWSGIVGGTQNDYNIAVDVDDDGNIYTTGYFYSPTCDLDPLDAVQSYNQMTLEWSDMFVTKMDPLGVIQFIHHFGSDYNLGGSNNERGIDILVDSMHDKYYVSGTIQGHVDLDASAVQFNMDYMFTAFVGSYQLDGNLEMVRTFGDYNTSGFSLRQDEIGQVYGFGTSSNNLKFYTTSGVVTTLDNEANGLYFFRMSDCAEPLPTSVVLSPDPLVACYGEEVTLTATPINGGTNPTYTWYYDNGTGIYVLQGETENNITFEPNFLETVITCSIISSEGCASQIPTARDSVEYIFSEQTNPSIYLDVSEFWLCPNDSVVFTAVVSEAGNSPAYQWLLDGVPIPGGNASTQTIYYESDDMDITCLLMASGCPNVDTLSTNPFTVSFFEFPNVAINQNGNTLSGVYTLNNTYQWANCDPFYTISSGNTINFSPGVSGTYALIVNTLWCADTSECYDFTFISDVSELNYFGLTISPNPTDGWVQLNCTSSTTSNMNLTVYNALGSIVHTQKMLGSQKQSVNLSAFEKGVYYMKLENEYGMSVEQVVLR